LKYVQETPFGVRFAYVQLEVSTILLLDEVRRLRAEVAELRGEMRALRRTDPRG
jgi:hypothetical protein